MNRELKHSISHGHAACQDSGQGVKRKAPKELGALQSFASWLADCISANSPGWVLGETAPDLTEGSGTYTECLWAVPPFTYMKFGFGPVHFSHSICPLPSMIYKALSCNLSGKKKKHYMFSLVVCNLCQSSLV